MDLTFVLVMLLLVSVISNIWLFTLYGYEKDYRMKLKKMLDDYWKE